MGLTFTLFAVTSDSSTLFTLPGHLSVMAVPSPWALGRTSSVDKAMD